MKKMFFTLLMYCLVVVVSPCQTVSSDGMNAYGAPVEESRLDMLRNGVVDDGGKVYGGSVYATRGEMLTREFTVNLEEGGTYYFSAHAMGIVNVPTTVLTDEAKNKVYPLQPIGVTLDGKYLGELALTTDEWQSTTIAGIKTLTLSAGNHTVTFESAPPFYPEVDAVRLTKDAEKAAFDMTLYNEYVSSLKANMEKNKGNTAKIESPPPASRLELLKDGLANEGGRTSSASNSSYSWEVTPYTASNPSGNYAHVMNVPVVYTYYRKMSLTAGQSFTFHTVPTGTDSYYTVDPVMYVYCVGNSTGWYNDDDTGFHPKVSFTAPVTGDYYLILRAYSNYYSYSASGSQGVVNVYQNGVLLQSNAPVSGYMASMANANSGTLNFFTGYSTGIPMLWLTIGGKLSPIRFRGGTYWYVSPMSYYWFDDARFRVIKSGSGSIDYAMLVSSEGAWWVYWGNCDIFGACKQASSTMLSYFPNLYANDAIQSAGSTNTYNCAAWAGGLTSGWFWGCLSPNNASACTSMYYGSAYAWTTWDNYFGNSPSRYTGARTYTRTSANSANGEVALWSTNGAISGLTHLSVRHDANNNPHGYDWESKPGSLERTFHPMNALSGTSYGSIFSYYRDASRDPYDPWAGRMDVAQAKEDLQDVPFFSLEESIALGLTVLPNVTLRTEEQDKLSELMRLHASPHVKLEAFYTAWMKACQAPELQVSSNPLTFLELPECQRIVTYSQEAPEATLSFLMDKILTGEDDSFEVQFSSMLLSAITHQTYGDLMEEVKEEWGKHNYTETGAYIAPTPLGHTKNYIRKILNTEYLHQRTAQDAEGDNHEIFQVSPNPVISQSQIRVKLDKPATVSLVMYDGKGSVSRMWEPGTQMQAGTYYYELQAKDFEGGLYFCKLTIDGKILTRKVLLR